MKEYDRESLFKENGGFSSIVEAVTGAVVVADAALAEAAALNIKKKRKSTTEILTHIKAEALSRVEQMQMQARNKIIEAEEKLNEFKKKVEH